MEYGIYYDKSIKYTIGTNKDYNNRHLITKHFEYPMWICTRVCE